MVREANSDFIEEKNKETNRPIKLFTIYDYDGEDNNLYFTNQRSNVTFDSQEYVSFPIEYDNISENTQGEIDSMQVTISNVSRLIQAYLENYDWCDKKVSIKTVWSDKLDDTDNYIEDIFYIDSYTADAHNAIFTLMSRYNVLNVVLPREVYSRNYCRYKEFKGTRCGYSGSETECDRSLQRCRELGNQRRFGGFPSVPQRPVVTG